MSQILKILKEILNEIESHNPHNLIGKGGTILSLYYLNHRDSEDLDFDTTIDKSQHKKIEKYFLNIFEKLKAKGVLKDYKLVKGTLAMTNRYHMNLILQTHKDIFTKIDVDFIKPIKNLRKKGQLYYYPLEGLFIGKCITFTRRKEFKDIYDVSHILHKIKIDTFKGNQNVISLVESVINTVESEEISQLYRDAFRNRDIKFKDFKPSQLEAFKSRIVKDLRILINKIRK